MIDHIPDLKSEIWNAFDVTMQRTYVFINADGTVEKKGYGSLASDVEALIANEATLQ